ncbi:MAG: hypothetical protein ABFS39_05100 [Pseudomonadota bacterium]
MDKELSDNFQRLEILHDMTMQLMLGQYHLYEALIGSLLESGAVDIPTFHEHLQAAQVKLKNKGVLEDERLFVDSWLEQLDEALGMSNSPRPRWCRGVILGDKTENREPNN